MTKTNCIAAVMAIAIGFAPLAVVAQDQATNADTGATSHSSASLVPLADRASKEQVTKLLEVMRLRSQLASTMKALQTMIQGQIATQMSQVSSNLPAGKELSNEEQGKLNAIQQKYMKMALDVYPIDAMMDDVTEIYQRYMSRSDVEAFIAFYSSPPGQHLLDAQPAIMAEYMPVAMKRVNERSNQLAAEMMKDIEEQVKTKTPSDEKK